MRILAQNFVCPIGELDLVALDRDTLVFVEVRSTEDRDVTVPALSVDRHKQDRLTRISNVFLQKRGLLGRPARFDVVLVSWPKDAKTPEIVHHRNAFDAVGTRQMFC
jgi:putative endonuclease